jgi:hypothetical protein
VTTIAVAPSEDAESERFLDILQPLLPGAYRMAYAMLQSAHEAEDAVQEAVLRGLGRPRPAASRLQSQAVVPDHRHEFLGCLNAEFETGRADGPHGPDSGRYQGL